MRIESKLQALGIVLPPPLGMKVPFAWVRLRGTRAYISGHAALAPDGSVARPLGKIGAGVTVEEGYQSARLATVAILSSLQRALGDLDRVTAWLRVAGMVNAAPDFTQTTAVMNGCSDLLLELYGAETGQHARTAIGAATLPLGVPVVIEAEVEIA